MSVYINYLLSLTITLSQGNNFVPVLVTDGKMELGEVKSFAKSHDEQPSNFNIDLINSQILQ